jgi:hypothetical protein
MRGRGMSKLVRKLSRQQWAQRINSEAKETARHFVKIGQSLIAAKKQLGYGRFSEMIENDLAFDARTAQRLMAIGRDPNLANATHESHLPTAWTTLFLLAGMPPETFEQAVASGAIHPKTTRKEAKALAVMIDTKDTTRTISSPSYTVEKEEPRRISSIRVEAPEATAARDILQTLETAVRELDQHVRRHGLTPAIKTGIRAVMNALTSIGKGSESVH